MSRACGGEGGGRNRALRLGQSRQHVPLVELRGGPAIEANELDLGMGVEKGAKVVRDRIIRNVRIETPGTARGREDVPKCNALFDERPHAPCIVGRPSRARGPR